MFFGYDSSKRIVEVIDSSNQSYLYKYDRNNNLTSVTYPDGKTKTYLYGESAYTPGANLPHALTGIIDENGTRYATYWYDAQGRAYQEEIAPNLNQGIDKAQLAYNVDGSGNPISTVVTDPLGTTRTYNFTTVLGVVKSTGNTQPGGSGCGAASLSQTYDPNGNVATRTDFNGNTTTYIYDLSRNLETSRTEAVGRPEMRTITTTWHPTFRLPLTITEPGRVTTNVYDDTSGNLLSRSIADTVTGKTRTVTYTYTTTSDGTLANLLKSVDGPRTDVSDITTYTYYPNGDLQTVTNALGHTTNITQYDPSGRPLTITDPNTIITDLTYWPRGWLKSRSVAGETTYYDYDGVGQIKKVTSPDGSFISYHYDDAHRLTDIYDAQGDYIHYTLDAIGNRVKEDVYNNLGILVTTKSRVFDALNRLWKDIGALNQTTTYAYDANGNLTRIDGPLATQNEVTINSYDALNRLASSTDGLNGITRYGYDALDQLRSVTDPRNLTTSYFVNALGEQTQLTSPDTGTTNSVYDAAGNLISRTDADGKVVSYSYDALNRVTAIKYDGQPQYSFSYDQGQNALGKLSGMSNGSNQANPTTWSYNSQGRVQSKVQQTGSVSLTTSYSYYPTGQLASITYPSGKIVAYGYNLLGQLASIGVNGQPVIIGASYQPFGPVASWTWGNNSPYARSFDSDGRLFSYPLGPLNTRALGFDNASRIQNQTETSPFANTIFTYDELDRLKTWQPPNTNQSYYYDANGNRISLVLGGSSYTNTISPSSNRLQSVAGPSAKTYSYNNSGNRITDGTNSFNYDSAQRLTSVTFPGGSSSYSINALGQRILKSGSGGNINFVYDEGGKLIGEYDSTGQPIEETLYLGDLPVAVLR